MPPVVLTGSRVLLRPWTAADRAPFAGLNADPEVMAHFPAPLDREQSDALVDRIERGFDERGWGFWALDVRSVDGRPQFAGFVGLNRAPETLPVGGQVEIGWRLARRWWGHGYASEAARLALSHGFDGLGLEHIVSFTAVTNLRSQSVMRRIGMEHDAAGDFDHPALPVGHRLRPHVLYRMSAERYRLSVDASE